MTTPTTPEQIKAWIEERKEYCYCPRCEGQKKIDAKLVSEVLTAQAELLRLADRFINRQIDRFEQGHIDFYDDDHEALKAYQTKRAEVLK